MYSQKILRLLKRKGIEVGDEISVHCDDGDYSGILMPRPPGNDNIIVIKLSNGYNIGVCPSGTGISLIRKNVLKRTAIEPTKPEKGDICILGCGGTIASKVDYKTGAVYPAISASELRAAFPKLGDIAKIHSKQLFSLFSEDMNSTHWKILADAIEHEIKDGSSGMVVMHGTDTLTYTSAAISFMLQNLPIPVVFVGSQRSSDRPSSENEMNLLNAVFAAKHDIGEVGVCMHAGLSDDFCHLHRGTTVRKMHTSRRDAFHSINSLPIAKLDYRSKLFEPLSQFRKRSEKSEFKPMKKINSNVAMIYVHPNIKPKLISSLDDYDGVVLVGTGLGHIPANPFNDKSVKSLLPAVKDLISSGIPVALSSQTISGRLCFRVYSTGRLLMDAGLIGDGMDWTPETAYVKLCWALGQTKNQKKIRDLMVTNIAGEISERSPTGEY